MGEPAYKAASGFLNNYFKIGPPEVLLTYEPYVKELAKEASRLLSCQEDEITYIKNTTEGLFLASESLPLLPGDEVLLWGREYPATLLTWLKKRKDGILVKILSGDDNAQSVDTIIAAIGPRTKVICIAWVQHYDGYMSDLELLGNICKEKGIYLVVDAVQGVGVREITLRNVHVDFFVCGGQKYIGGIVGIGFMYVRRGVIADLKDLKTGIRSVEKFDQDSYTLRSTASRFEDGTINLLGIVALHAAIKHINRLGIRNIEKKNLMFLAACKSTLSLCGIPYISYERQGNIIAIPVTDPIGLAIFLRERAIYIKPLRDVVRISFTHSSKRKDFDVLVAAIQAWLRIHPQPTIVPHTEIGLAVS